MVRIGLYQAVLAPGATCEILGRYRPGEVTFARSDPLWYWRSRSILDPGTGCWLFQGAHDRDGYGQARRQGVLVLAHRAAYEAVNGPIPKGQVMLHSCDQPQCCNPDHVTPGTQADNMADAAAKGRTASGSRNGMAKLTETQRREILASDAPAGELAAAYGVGVRTIDRVRKAARLELVQGTSQHPGAP
jgi:hypothetical protein